MSNASELLAQSSSFHRQSALGNALRYPVWTLVRRLAHRGLAQMFRYETGWKFPCCWFSVHPKMMLGVGPVVNSCGHAFVVAICWLLAVNSLRKDAAHTVRIYHIRYLFAYRNILRKFALSSNRGSPSAILRSQGAIRELLPKYPGDGQNRFGQPQDSLTGCLYSAVRFTN